MHEATYHELARLEHATKATRHVMHTKAEFGVRTRSQPALSARELRALAREERREREDNHKEQKRKRNGKGVTEEPRLPESRPRRNRQRGSTVCIATAYDPVMGGTNYRSTCRKATKAESDSEDVDVMLRRAMCAPTSTGRCALRKYAEAPSVSSTPPVRNADDEDPNTSGTYALYTDEEEELKRIMDEEDAKFERAMAQDPGGPSAFRLAHPGRGKMQLPPTGNRLKLRNVTNVYSTERDPMLDRMQNLGERMDLALRDPSSVTLGYRPRPIAKR